MIRVLLVDDHAILRQGLRGMLESDPEIEVVGEGSSGPQGVALCATENPDVVLMDVQMPGGDGIDASEKILAAQPGMKIIVLTTYGEAHAISRALDVGVAGYLLKDTGLEELLRAVRTVLNGGTVLAPRVAESLVASLRAPEPVAVSLSQRELDVLNLVALGQTNVAIGKRLFISETTVKTHLLRAFTKLEVTDRTAAVTRAVQLGLLELPARAGA